MWKWEQITIDFITNLSRKVKGFDIIWVILDLLTKSSSFLALWESSLDEKLDDINMREIISRHGAPISIVSNRDVRFTSRF